MLEFDHITKQYRSAFGKRRTLALSDVSFRVEPGEVFGFLGANGAGKTTAIHLAMGFMRPSSGRGFVLGKPLGNVPARAKVGFLGENFALYPRRADRLLCYYGALKGLGWAQCRKLAISALAEVGLEDHASTNVKKMSRGMQQRVAIAQAILNDPDLLILDEPTSALDPFARIAVRELLMRLRQRGKTVFLSSHLLSEVEQVCDRVAILRRGQLIRVASLAELLEEQSRWEIRARGITSAQFPNAKFEERTAVIVVPYAEQRATLERIWNAGGEVLAVNRDRRTLEDVFVDLAAPGAQAAGETH